MWKIESEHSSHMVKLVLSRVHGSFISFLFPTASLYHASTNSMFNYHSIVHYNYNYQ